MTAKMRGKPYRKDSRPDWEQVRVRIMRWCLRVKLIQHWDSFGSLLLSTGDKPIVEASRKDDFWGAKPINETTLVGMNVLGRLLMELREELRSEQHDRLLHLAPVAIPDFLLLGESIQDIDGLSTEQARTLHLTTGSLQPTLFAEDASNAMGYQGARNSERSGQGSSDTSGAAIRIDRLRPYTDYVESGAAWLGQVPTHWRTLPHRSLFEEIKERDHPNEEMLSVTITRGVIKQRELLADSSKKDSSKNDKSAYKLVCPGDIAYNKMRAWQGAFGASDLRGIISPAYIVQRPRGAGNPKYYHYLFRTPAFAKEAERWSYGISSDMWSLRPEHFKVMYSPLPPVEEQAAIVRYLDHATRKIDKAIRAKRKIIALLNEQKQAIIHRAVTRGLDSNVSLKDSGIPWLGQIPAHWKAVRIKYLLREVDRRSETGAETLLSMRMHHGLVPFAEHFSRPPQAASLVGFKFVKPGQFVINRMQAGNGVIYTSSLTGLVSPDYAVFDPLGDVNVEFLGELFRSHTVRAKFRAESKGLGTGTSGFLRLYNNRLGAIHVALPPRQEQNAILAGLGARLVELNAVIARIESEITLLREYRTRLIADVVTGKLDVREAAVRLPEPEAESAPDIAGAEEDEDALEEAA